VRAPLNVLFQIALNLETIEKLRKMNYVGNKKKYLALIKKCLAKTKIQCF